MDSDEGDFSDMDELDFDSSPEDTNVELENQYYNAKTLKDENPELALREYQKVLDLEGGEKGDWGFKALKQMMKINFRLGRFDEMMRLYKELLTYIKKAVTRNYSEKSINSILDYVSTSKQSDLLLNFYHTTLNALKEAKNDRLWFKANLKLGKLYLDNAEWPLLQRIIKELRASCETEDGELDSKKGTNLLEIFALEIQMYTLQKNNKKLKDLYNQSLNIKSAIPHPLIMGIIRECGGKMHLGEAEFEKAHTDFFEAFKNFDESGSPRRIQCLKYLVLSSMLRRVGINPLDSQEAKPYRNDPEVTAMTSLVAAYHANDIHSFEQLLRQHRAAIMEDQFIREHIEELLRNVRTQVLCRLIQPYTRIRIPFISAQLNIDQAEVEALIVSCILDNLIVGKIDQQTQVLVIERAAVQQQYQTMDKLACQVAGLHKAVVGRLPLKH